MVPPTPLRPVCQWSDAELSQLVRGALRGEAEAPPPCAAEQSLLLEDGRSGFVELSQLSKGARYGPFMYVGQGGGTHVAEPTFKYVGHGAGDFHVPEPTPRTYWWLCYPACCLLCCCVLLPLLLALVLRRPQPPAPPADTLAPGGIVCEQAFDTAAQRFLAPDITLAQIHFCCDHFDIGCSLGTTAGTTVTVPVVTVPVATVTTTDGDDGGFSCVTAGENVADTWSEAKKKFCCRNAGVGCLTPPRVVEFDCDAGLPKWDTGWSPMKKDFCCRTAAPVGCPGFTLSTSTTTRVSSSAQEVTAPVGVVAPLSTSAAPKASPGVATEDPGVQCMDFANWPFKDGEADCGACKHLVYLDRFTTCQEYCESFGQQCFYAAEDVNGPAGQTECKVLTEVTCADNIKALQVSSNDMICGCKRPEPTPVPSTTVQPPTTSSPPTTTPPPTTVSPPGAPATPPLTPPPLPPVATLTPPPDAAAPLPAAPVAPAASAPPALGAPGAPAAPVAAAPASCKAYGEWPGLEGNADCGQCRHQVVVSDFRSCGEYCESFGHQCFFAGANLGGELDCQALYTMDCDFDTRSVQGGPHGVVCGCASLGPPPAPEQPPATPAPPAPQEVACLPVAQWPDRDGEVSCGACKELVSTHAFKGCGPYCGSFGQDCFYAAAGSAGPDSVHGGTCQVSSEAACGDDLSALTASTGDMICGCRSPAAVGEVAVPVPAAPETPPPTLGAGELLAPSPDEAPAPAPGAVGSPAPTPSS